MDLFSIFGQVLGAVWFLIPFAIVAALFKSPWVKGVIGEFAVNVGVKLFLDKKRYHLLKNVTIPFDGSTTQIDHIIVSIYGIFVVETKNMKGWIFGGENQKNWTQKIFKHSQKFQNPLHQNYKHVKALAALLELEETKFRSVVVFMGESTFKTPMPRNVTYGFGLIRFIWSHDIKVLKKTECRQIVRVIETRKYPGTLVTSRAHVENLKVAAEKKATEIVCPKCGSAMKLRVAKKGANPGTKFWGCAQYPHCRGTLNVT